MIEEPLHFLEDIVREVNSLRDPCRVSYLTPSGLRRMFLLMLRGHWSSAANHGPDLDESLSCLHWKPDPRERTLDIELQGTDDAKKAGDTAIFVKLGNFRFSKVAFGDLAEVSEDNATHIKVFLTTCTLQIQHEAPLLDTALNMAFSTFAFLAGYNDALLEIMGEESTIFPEVIGEPNQVREAPRSGYRVDFVASLKLSLCVSTTAESHRLKTAFDMLTPSQQ